MPHTILSIEKQPKRYISFSEWHLKSAMRAQIQKQLDEKKKAEKAQR